MRRLIFLQAGHVPPLQPGHETETGTAGEAEFTRVMRNMTAWWLRKLSGDSLTDGVDFEPVQAGGLIPPTLGTVDAAVYFHADGSASKTSSGYSFGYPADGWRSAQRFATLATTLFETVAKHPGSRRRDNYTPDMAFYYGYRRVDARPGPEVLIEFGFLTNPTERAFLSDWANRARLSWCVAAALIESFGFRRPPVPRAPSLQSAMSHAKTTAAMQDGVSWPVPKGPSS